MYSDFSSFLSSSEIYLLMAATRKDSAELFQKPKATNTTWQLMCAVEECLDKMQEGTLEQQVGEALEEEAERMRIEQGRQQLQKELNEPGKARLARVFLSVFLA